MEVLTEKKDYRKLVYPILILTALVFFLIGGTYAWIVFQTTGNKRQVIKAGTLSLILDDKESIGINLEDAIPMSDRQGMATRAYTFTVQNDSNIHASYKLYLEDEAVEGSRIADEVIRYSLTKNESEEVAKDLTSTYDDENKRLIADELINGKTSITTPIDTYTLRLWIKDGAVNSDIAGKEFKVKIRLEATQIENVAP